MFTCVEEFMVKINVLFSGLFIDVGTNYSVLDHTNLSFIYEDVLSPGPNADGEFVSQLLVILSALNAYSHWDKAIF